MNTQHSMLDRKESSEGISIAILMVIRAKQL